jgi:four helix bundle protein
MAVRSVKELEVYREAFQLAQEIYKATKRFPSEEKFGLTSQIRRSSRSVALNLREAWAKRRYEGHFVSKLSDCDGENAETDTALDFARECGYLTAEEHEKFVSANRRVGRMLGRMLQSPKSFLIDPKSSPTPDS